MYYKHSGKDLASDISKKVYKILNNTKNLEEFKISIEGDIYSVPQIKYTFKENIVLTDPTT